MCKKGFEKHCPKVHYDTTFIIKKKNSGNIKFFSFTLLFLCN